MDNMDQATTKDSVTCRYEAADKIECDGIEYAINHGYVPGQTLFEVYLAMYLTLFLVAGITSGLTLALISLDTTTLQVLVRSGDTTQQRKARLIIPLANHYHLLLLTLLQANAVAGVCMPIIMKQISSDVVAAVVSITTVLFLGEVFYRALCGKYGLTIAAFLVPLVWLLIVVFFVIAWPIAKLLDCVLGDEHATFYRRADIKAMVDIHGEGGGRKGYTEEGPLTYDEVLIIKSALDMNAKVGADAMIPINNVFMIDIEERMDDATMKQIRQASFSRIPIYENSRNNIVAILLVKTIIALDPEDAITVRELVYKQVHCGKLLFMPESTPLYDLLNEFQMGRSHMCLMTRDHCQKQGFGKEQDVEYQGSQNTQVITGVITLEDVIEELLGEEIFDETDSVYSNAHRRMSVVMARRASTQPQKRAYMRSGSITLQGTSAPSNRQAIYTRDGETVKLLG